jgi:acetolactate decarboxylase
MAVGHEADHNGTVDRAENRWKNSCIALDPMSLSAPCGRAFQIATSAALVQGAYDGVVSSRLLLANGDFGIGTFAHLDGEMVILDGQIYQALGDGSMRHRADDFGVPFAIVTRFQPDESFDLSAVRTLTDLELACDPHRASENLFYALRLDGAFDRLHTRAFQPAPEGTGIDAAAAAEPQFHFTDVVGTLVGFWSPRYSGAFSVPGYHFHFISADRTRASHVLDCAATTLRASVQRLSEYDVRLPESGSFLTADLAIDAAKTLQRVE